MLRNITSKTLGLVLERNQLLLKKKSIMTRRKIANCKKLLTVVLWDQSQILICIIHLQNNRIRIWQSLKDYHPSPKNKNRREQHQWNPYLCIHKKILLHKKRVPKAKIGTVIKKKVQAVCPSLCMINLQNTFFKIKNHLIMQKVNSN